MSFAVRQFKLADVDGNKSITFDEFVSYYNGLRDTLKVRLSLREASIGAFVACRETRMS